MSPLSYFFPRIQTVFLTVFLACSLSSILSAQNLPSSNLLRYEAPSVTPDQERAQQLVYIDRRAEEQSHFARNANTTFILMFLFGVGSARWAQKTGRSGTLWFLIGFALNLFAVLLILRLNRKKGKMRLRRYRQVKDFWTLAQP